MAILNQAELEAANLSLLPDNTQGTIEPADHRLMNQNMIDSLQSYAGVIDDGNVPVIPITATPTKWAYFTNNVTSPNALLESDVANDRVLIYEPALYFVTLRFFGKWPAIEDLKLEVYVNGVANAVTPIVLEQSGAGVSDPVIISVTDVAFIVNSAMVAAGPGGNSAEVALYASSDTGTFDVEQDDITMGIEYNPLSIRTVG